MKLIIEQKDVGTEIDLDSLVIELALLAKRQYNERFINEIKEIGKTPAGASVIQQPVKQRNKPGPKPKKKQTLSDTTTL